MLTLEKNEGSVETKKSSATPRNVHPSPKMDGGTIVVNVSWKSPFRQSNQHGRAVVDVDDISLDVMVC